MDFTSALVCVIFTTLAASYAWGMRGFLVGGEKGAMLPGAFIGLIIAWFSGGGIRENFWIVAATGLMGMTYGGTETYGETIGMVLHAGKPDYRPVKGYAGLAVKGALWFSVFGGFTAMSLACMSGSIYKTSDIIIFCLLIPVLQQIGCRIFNYPYDKEKGIYPKTYYSVTRREEWGSNLVLIIAMTAMAVIKGDDLMLSFICAGVISGAIGWVVAMKAYAASVFPMKNGRYFFGRLYYKGLIDGWKIMEFVLGAAGGFGISLSFCLNYDHIDEYNRLIAVNGRWSAVEPAEGVMPYVSAVLIVAVIAVNFYQFICDKKSKTVNSHICDLIERPLYNLIPMLLVLLGSLFTARIMTLFMLVFVCLMKCVIDRFDKAKSIYIWQISALALCAVVFAGDIISGGYGEFAIILAGTVPYMMAQLVWDLSKYGRKGKSVKDMFLKTSLATVYPCFIIQSFILCIAAYKIFEI